ncbi:MAG: alpha/beta hydrolase [Clostridia bacterium]|nr:alpha/beta hydrolase [Clostridia bacterium]
MLRFDRNAYTDEHLTGTNGEIHYCAWYGIPYAEHPASPAVQILHICIPEAYFREESINGYTAHTAPVFFPNSIGGYLEAHPCRPALRADGSFNTEAAALARGYVVISPGIRGSNTQSGGRYVGKAPAAIVDLKAAVRFIRSIADSLCGDMEKIISNGTSAGGAMSALLAASGDSPLYEACLREIGAPQESDRIFAASCYCPITNLENADAAYEWQYGHLDVFYDEHWEREGDGWKVTPVRYPIPTDRMRLSRLLSGTFPAYINRTAPPELTMNEDGSGSFAESIKKHLLDSAQKATAAGVEIPLESGVDLSAQTVDIRQYSGCITRMKPPCGFDDPDLYTYENDLFGSEAGNKRHFTAFGLEHSRCGGEKAPEEPVFLMNAMHFIRNEGGAQYWRIRHGAADRDTSFAVPVLLAECLRAAGRTVDFDLPWGIPHSGDYDLPALFDWIDSICR